MIPEDENDLAARLVEDEEEFRRQLSRVRHVNDDEERQIRKDRYLAIIREWLARRAG